jgi:hypothetical protein
LVAFGGFSGAGAGGVVGVVGAAGAGAGVVPCSALADPVTPPANPRSRPSTMSFLDVVIAMVLRETAGLGSRHLIGAAANPSSILFSVDCTSAG